MRGEVPSQPNFASLINVETMIAGDHPIRAIKRVCRRFDPEIGDKLS
jgi:hypothetical protein